MRTLVVALAAATILAFAGVTALTAGGGSEAGATDSTQKRQIQSGGVAGAPQGGLLRRAGDVIAKGDMTGSGGGGKMGGKMGDMMGSMGQGKGKGKS
jgi:hypothetical protein